MTILQIVTKLTRIVTKHLHLVGKFCDGTRVKKMVQNNFSQNWTCFGLCKCEIWQITLKMWYAISSHKVNDFSKFYKIWLKTPVDIALLPRKNCVGQVDRQKWRVYVA